MGNETWTSGMIKGIQNKDKYSKRYNDELREQFFKFTNQGNVQEVIRGACVHACMFFFRRWKALSLLRAGTGEQLPQPSPRTLLGGGWLVRGQMHKRGNGRRSIMMIRDATLPMRVKDFRACGWERREGGTPRRHTSSRAARRRRDPVTRHKCGRMWRQRRARRRGRRGARRADRMESGVDAQRRFQ